MKKEIKEFIRKSSFYKLIKPLVHHKEMKWKKERNELFKKEAVPVLQCFANALNSEGIKYWPAFGTLLGYYRNHDFIPFDIDIDMAAFLCDSERIRKALNKEGFSLIRYYRVNSDGGYEECYKHKDYSTTIDVFYFQKNADCMYCYTFSPEEKMNKPESLNRECKFSCHQYRVPQDTFVKAEFKGIEICVPEHPELQLEAIYGPNFMIPDPNYEHHENANITFFTYDEKPATGFLKVGYNEI